MIAVHEEMATKPLTASPRSHASQEVPPINLRRRLLRELEAYGAKLEE